MREDESYAQILLGARPLFDQRFGSAIWGPQVKGGQFRIRSPVEVARRIPNLKLGTYCPNNTLLRIF